MTTTTTDAPLSVQSDPDRSATLLWCKNMLILRDQGELAFTLGVSEDLTDPDDPDPYADCTWVPAISDILPSISEAYGTKEMDNELAYEAYCAISASIEQVLVSVGYLVDSPVRTFTPAGSTMTTEIDVALRFLRENTPSLDEDYSTADLLLALGRIERDATAGRETTGVDAVIREIAEDMHIEIRWLADDVLDLVERRARVHGESDDTLPGGAQAWEDALTILMGVRAIAETLLK